MSKLYTKTELSALTGFPYSTIDHAFRSYRKPYRKQRLKPDGYATLKNGVQTPLLSLDNFLSAALEGQFRPKTVNKHKIYLKCIHNANRGDLSQYREQFLELAGLMFYAREDVEDCQPLPRHLATLRQLVDLSGIRYETLRIWLFNRRLEPVEVSDCYTINGRRIRPDMVLIDKSAFIEVVTSHTKRFKNYEAAKRMADTCEATVLNRLDDDRSKAWLELSEAANTRAKQLLSIRAAKSK